MKNMNDALRISHGNPRGFLITLITMICMVINLSPSMAAPHDISMHVTVGISQAQENSHHSHQTTQASEVSYVKSGQVDKKGCHAVSMPSSHQQIHQEPYQELAMKSLSSGEHADNRHSCCEQHCECAEGACTTVFSSVYALMNTPIFIFNASDNVSFVAQLKNVPNSFHALQYRPPKVAVAG